MVLPCVTRLLNVCTVSYQFDVDLKTGHFLNRRTFAYVDTGIADGIQVDTKGNVYSGCGDGVHVCQARTISRAAL